MNATDSAPAQGPGDPPELDIAAEIDRRPVSRVQLGVIVLCGSIALLDGADTQSIGVAAPLIAAALGTDVKGFGPVFSAALIGAAVGALAFGPLADRYGRKRFLVVAATAFGLFTLLTALAGSMHQLIAVRFAAGLGLGGALPCFVALASEFAPRRLRASFITITWAAFPLGGMLGGLLNSALIGRYGWQAIFYLGGIAPIAVAVLLACLLPESPRQQLARPDGQARVARLLARMYGLAIAPSTRLVSRAAELPGMPVRHLFNDGRALATVILWVPFFMAFGTLTVVVLWTPTLLREFGIQPAATAFVVACNGLGAAIGMAGAGRLLERFGVVLTLVPAFLLGAMATAALGHYAASVPLAALFTGLVGLFVALGAAGAVALAACVYPEAIRSTGVGWAMGMGRIGQALAPLLAGALLLAAWSVGAIMLVIAAAPVIAAGFVLLLRRHTGRDSVTSDF